MRIRLPFAGAFLFLLALSAYLGLFQARKVPVNDKILHFLDFFILTLCFYWVLDTSRRRTLNLTLVLCTCVLAVGSEFLQGVIPNGRGFDVYDIAANILGSVAAVGLCTWYHRRMIERRRQARRYQQVPGEDVELGEGAGHAQESGTIPAAPSLEEEVDNWDENAVDEDEPPDSTEHVTRPPEDDADAVPTRPSKERNE